MKTPKSGQLYTINSTLYRVATSTDGCKGCALNNMFSCLGIVDGITKKAKLDCKRNSVIFKKL